MTPQTAPREVQAVLEQLSRADELLARYQEARKDLLEASEKITDLWYETLREGIEAHRKAYAWS